MGVFGVDGMAPRGLKTALKKSSPAVLTGSGKYRGFTVVRQGQKTNTKFKGITKRLESRVWSDGTLPVIARTSDARPGGHWGGPKGGRDRGSKVDAQLTRIINAGPAAMKNALHTYRLTKMALSGLSTRGLEPVMAQRAVISEKSRLATAADVIAYDKAANQLVVVELKCGFDHGRSAAAIKNGKACRMGKPLGGASDCNVNRHLAQLAVTRELFAKEKATLARVGELGLEQSVSAVLMYVNDQGVEFFELGEWWVKRAPQVVNAIA